MKTIHAIFEHGVFRPTEPVDLPENSAVTFEPRVVDKSAAPSQAMGKIYEILSRSYETDDPDLGTRHNEHQP